MKKISFFFGLKKEIENLCRIILMRRENNE